MEETLEREPQLTQEQIEDNKQKLMEYYEKNIPFLLPKLARRLLVLFQVNTKN